MYLHHVLKQDFIYLKLKNTLHASMLCNMRSEVQSCCSYLYCISKLVVFVLVIVTWGFQVSVSRCLVDMAITQSPVLHCWYLVHEAAQALIQLFIIAQSALSTTLWLFSTEQLLVFLPSPQQRPLWWNKRQVSYIAVAGLLVCFRWPILFTLRLMWGKVIFLSVLSCR